MCDARCCSATPIACFYCGREADTVDHIIAGDSDDPTNLTAACHTCNSAKSGRPLPDATLRKARAEARMIAADVERLAEQYPYFTVRSAGHAKGQRRSAD